MKRFRSVLGVVASTSMATIGLGLVMAPSAAADPAPAPIERTYLHLLADDNINVRGEESQALQLAYLTCALDKKTGRVINGTAPYLGAAKSAGMCTYVKGMSLADAKQQLQALSQGFEAPGNANWTNIDDDHDGYSNSNDGAPFYRGEH
jgi:hypothetical protein